MAFPLIAQPRRRGQSRPPGLASIDWKHPQAKGLTFWPDFGNPSLYDIAGGRVPTATGGGCLPGMRGMGYQHTGSGTLATWAGASGDGTDLSADIDFLILAAVDISTSIASQNVVLVSHNDGGLAHGYWHLQISSQTTFSLFWYIFHQVDFTITAVVPGFYTFALRRLKGGTYSLWVNGVKQADKSDANNLDPGANSVRLGNDGAGTGNVLGNYQAAGIWKNRAFSDSEVYALINNYSDHVIYPDDMFAGDLVGVAAAGGGGLIINPMIGPLDMQRFAT